MDHTFPYTLPHLELEVGPNAVPVRLRTSAQLQVEFTHDPGYPAIPTLPNGDPGEPGLPEYFDFKRILSPHPLVLTAPSNRGRFLIEAGADIFEYLSEDAIADIEHAMLARLREQQDDDLVDLMIPRLAALSLEDRP